MRLGTFEAKGGPKGQALIGILMDGNSVLNLNAAAPLYLKEAEKEKKPYEEAARLIPPSVIGLLEKGRGAMALARNTFKALSKWQKEEKKILG
ncbi:MAG TPA: hypothetical protein VLS90_07305, partial [Thermodesulfobacteriota bacterium]|nr:hypothetical protein [Thermodesulfobacteriota bacterium]